MGKLPAGRGVAKSSVSGSTTVTVVALSISPFAAAWVVQLKRKAAATAAASIGLPSQKVTVGRSATRQVVGERLVRRSASSGSIVPAGVTQVSVSPTP